MWVRVCILNCQSIMKEKDNRPKCRGTKKRTLNRIWPARKGEKKPLKKYIQKNTLKLYTGEYKHALPTPTFSFSQPFIRSVAVSLSLSHLHLISDAVVSWCFRMAFCVTVIDVDSLYCIRFLDSYEFFFFFSTVSSSMQFFVCFEIIHVCVQV